jgi:hypothetical protein
MQITGRPWEEITYSARDTNSGRYRSLTINVPVQNADMLYEVRESSRLALIPSEPLGHILSGPYLSSKPVTTR